MVGWSLRKARTVARNANVFHLVLRTLKRIFKKESPEPPDDPFAYVTAPKKPKPPHRSSAAVAEDPEE
jgi:hypothetical protein